MVRLHANYTQNPTDRHLWRVQGKKCFYCAGSLSAGAMTRDHLFPRCEHFPLALNKVMACKRCNGMKGCRHPTPEEVSRARDLYARCGFPAFMVG